MFFFFFSLNFEEPTSFGGTPLSHHLLPPNHLARTGSTAAALDAAEALESHTVLPT